MNVSLGNKWERFVDAKVKSGDFQTASEVLREGLRLLEEKELLKRISISSINELKDKLLEGIASLGRGEGIDGEKAFNHLRQRIKERKGLGRFVLSPEALDDLDTIWERVLHGSQDVDDLFSG